MWIIWSIEHNRYWKAGEMGYTFDRKEAGVYTFDEALRIVTNANQFCAESDPHEAMIPYQ